MGWVSSSLAEADCEWVWLSEQISPRLIKCLGGQQTLHDSLAFLKMRICLAGHMNNWILKPLRSWMAAFWTSLFFFKRLADCIVSRLSFWLQSEAFYVLSASTISFYKVCFLPFSFQVFVFFPPSTYPLFYFFPLFFFVLIMFCFPNLCFVFVVVSVRPLQSPQPF